MSLFENRTRKLPLWFMRQAGRYHSHYQNIRKQHDFMTMCKTPELACEITMGPLDEFDFDAAILFSDLLFPLEHLGMGLSYASGPPTLELSLKTTSDLEKLKLTEDAERYYSFQAQAVKQIKQKMPEHKTLLGFVGAPFTLYAYAIEGSHAGVLLESKKGLYDGRFQDFLEKLMPSLLTSARSQLQAGADALCFFDTAVGELGLQDYQRFCVPALEQLTKQLKSEFPDRKFIYFSKHTHVEYYRLLKNCALDVLAFDWRHDLAARLEEFGTDYYVQGNIDPAWLHLPWSELQSNIEGYFTSMQKTQKLWSKWIFGLGHGVLPQTPEANVAKTIELIRKVSSR